MKDLRVDFPDEQACLSWLVEWLYPDGITCKVCQKVTKHYKETNRQSYCCAQCGNHMHPMAGTIFHRSRTPLSIWFHAFYMLSNNKNGYSAVQLQRESGVTYKTAFRILHKIRGMMEGPEELKGEVEIDETFIHPNPFKRSSARLNYGRDARRLGQVLFGIVERGGKAKIIHVISAGERVLIPAIRKNIKRGSLIHSDGYRAYKQLPNWGYPHKTTNHSKLEFYREDSSTQNVENMWSHLKLGIKGTYRGVSSQHLQKYANEYAWRYSHRKDESMFWSLMSKIKV